MKRIVIGIVLVVAVVALALVYKVTHRSSAVEDILNRAEARMRARDALPAEQNGYTDLADALAVQVDYRAKPGQQHAPPCRALSAYDMGSADDTLKALRNGGTADRLAFEGALPVVRRAILKPAFAWPSILNSPGYFSDAHLKDEHFRLDQQIGARSVASSLKVEGVWAASQGRPGDAFGDYLLGTRLGIQIQKQGPVIAQMIGTAITGISVEALLHDLTTSQADAATYRKVETGLKVLPWSPSDFADAMDEDLWVHLRMMDQDPERGPGRLVNHVLLNLAIGDIPATYVRYRPCMEKLRSPEELGLPPNDDMMQSEYFKSVTLNRGMLSRLYAARTVAALRAYHEEKHAWPATLDVITTDTDPMTNGQPFGYRLVGSQPVLTSTSPLWKDIGETDTVQYYPYRNSHR